jgi:hypothetical protein
MRVQEEREETVVLNRPVFHCLHISQPTDKCLPFHDRQRASWAIQERLELPPGECALRTEMRAS